MRIAIEKLETFVVLRLQGEFDTFRSPPFLSEVDSLLREGVTRIVLNLRRVKFINSTALGAILRVSKELQSRKGELVISCPSRLCSEIMQKLGMDVVIPTYDSQDEAEQAVLALSSTSSVT